MCRNWRLLQASDSDFARSPRTAALERATRALERRRLQIPILHVRQGLRRWKDQLVRWKGSFPFKLGRAEMIISCVIQKRSTQKSEAGIAPV